MIRQIFITLLATSHFYMVKFKLIKRLKLRKKCTSQKKNWRRVDEISYPPYKFDCRLVGNETFECGALHFFEILQVL